MFGVNLSNIGLDYSHWSRSAAAYVPDDVAAVVMVVALAVFVAIIVAAAIRGSSNGTGWRHRGGCGSDVVVVVDQPAPRPSFFSWIGWGSGPRRNRGFQELPVDRPHSRSTSGYHGGSGGYNPLPTTRGYGGSSSGSGARTTTSYGGSSFSFSSPISHGGGGSGYQRLPTSR